MDSYYNQSSMEDSLANTSNTSNFSSTMAQASTSLLKSSLLFKSNASASANNNNSMRANTGSSSLLRRHSIKGAHPLATSFSTTANNTTTTTTVGDQSLLKNANDDTSARYDSIYAQFKLDTCKHMEDEANSVQLLRHYASVCAESAHMLVKQQSGGETRRMLPHQTSTLAVDQEQELQRESHVWQLIGALYEDELVRCEREKRKLTATMIGVDNNDIDDDDDERTCMQLSVDDNENAHGNGHHARNELINEAQIARNLERSSSLLRRIRLIIDWLERIAGESAHMRSMREKMSEFPERCSNWEHTLHHLKSVNGGASSSGVGGVLTTKKPTPLMASTRDFVNELDPDAPVRLGKPLHDLDQEDEYKLMEYAFGFVRAGDLASARDFCVRVGQSWRAATFEGFRLFNDENYNVAAAAAATTGSRRLFSGQQQSDPHVYNNEGNLNRDIWRLMVHKLIKDVRTRKYTIHNSTFSTIYGKISK